MTKIVSLDTETTGTDPSIHRVWEVGIVTESGAKMHYQVAPENFKLATPEALQIGGFYERFTWPQAPKAHDLRTVLYPIGSSGDQAYTEINSLDMAVEIAKALDGATILGACPHFDATMLRTLLMEHNVAHAWNHRYLDLGSFCAGAWGSEVPLSTKTIEERYPNADKHNALSDAEWNMEVYRQITGSGPDF